MAGCYFTIGSPDGVFCLSEGFATAATIHEATGHAVAVAFNAGNLEAVARALRQKFPHAKLILCADNDHRTDGNPGLEKATAAARAVGGLLAVPDFGPDRPEDATDFNDLAQLCGAGAVGRAIAGAEAPAEAEHQPGNDDAPAGEPVPFEMDIPPTAWPDKCLPPGIAEAAQAIAEHAAAPTAMAGMAVIAAVAHIAMRLLDALHPKTGNIPASLFILTEGASGSRKTECFKLATRPIAERERKRREEHKAAVQALEKEAAHAKQKERNAIMGNAPPDPQTIFTDVTTQKIEQAFVNGSAPAISLSTDEGGTLLGGHSLKAETRAASLSALTRLFDGSGVQRDRVLEGQSGFRYGIRFGLFMSAQPVVLRDALSDPLMRGQGFLPRFLYAAPASLAGTRLLDWETLVLKADEDPRIRQYWERLEHLDRIPTSVDAHGGLCLPTVGMDEAAVDAWLSVYNDTEFRQGKDGDLEALGAFASRAGELAARVAAVFAVWRCYGAGAGQDEVVVTGQDMRQAAALVVYSLSEWQRQGASSILSRSERDALGLLEWLHRKDWEDVTRSQIAKHCPNALRHNKKKTRRDEAIAELLRRHWLVEEDGRMVVVKKLESPAATAIPATPATSSGFAGNSKSSRNSSSNPADVFFPPKPARQAPAHSVDVQAGISGKSSTIGEYRKKFEGAWWTAGTDERADAPYVTRAALEEYLLTIRQIEEGYLESLVGALIAAEIISPVDEGWVVINEIHASVLMASKNSQRYDGQKEAGDQAEQQNAADDKAKAALVVVIQDFDKRGELVNTAIKGQYSAYGQLNMAPAYPKGVGRDHLIVLLRELETDRVIFRRTVPTPNRSKKQVFTCVPEPESVPIPDAKAPPSNYGPGAACAD